MNAPSGQAGAGASAKTDVVYDVGTAKAGTTIVVQFEQGSKFALRVTSGMYAKSIYTYNVEVSLLEEIFLTGDDIDSDSKGERSTEEVVECVIPASSKTYVTRQLRVGEDTVLFGGVGYGTLRDVSRGKISSIELIESAER